MGIIMAKYQQIVEWVKEEIAQNKLKNGDKLESEHVLSKQFKVSRQTVRHALGVLEKEGMIKGRQGSGNYVAIPQKKNDQTARENTVVLISTYVNAYIFPNIIQGMEQVLAQRGYVLQVMFTYNKISTERKILEDILQMREVAGFIIEPTKSALPSFNRGFYEEILRRKIPVVFFHSHYDDLPISHISIDDKTAGKEAARFLIKNGHKKIGGIFKLDDAQGHRRFAGYVEALLEAGLPIPDEKIVWIDTLDEREEMRLCREKILERISDCTACVCYNDTVAHGLSLICQKEGIRIPMDLSVVSIDNSELAQLNSVPLTAMVHPMKELGVRTAKQFLKLVDNPEQDVTYEFPPEMVVRESVCKKI